MALPKEERLQQEKPEESRLARYRVGDATVESIALVHANNQRGLLLNRDELAGWLGSFDRYTSGEADMQTWIEMYEGRPIKVDRKTSTPPTLDIARPAVSVLGTIQPKVLAERLKKIHFESGFAARLMPVHPPERPRRWTDADVTEETQDEYIDLVRALYEIPYEGEPRIIEIEAKARDLFKRFVNENADLIHKLPEGPLRSTLAKIER